MNKITVANFKVEVKKHDFNNAPTELIEAIKDFDTLAEFYNENKMIKESLDLLFEKVQQYIESTASKPTKTKSKKAVPKKNVPAKKAPTKKKVAPKPTVDNQVSAMPLEIKFMNRYLKLSGTKVTLRQIELFYKALQKAGAERLIRKSSKYADLILAIGDDLETTYNQMGATATFEVPEDIRLKVEKVAKSYAVLPSVMLIKRFINLYGNITKEKAERLLKSIKNAKSNGKVTSKDAHYKRVIDVEAHLSRYVDNNELVITQVQLDGLAGIADMGK